MALHKSMLEEFGLGTVWVRRGAASASASASASADASVAVPDQSIESTAIALDRKAAAVAPPMPVEETHTTVARKADPADTLTALDAALSAAKSTQGNARQALVAKIDSPRTDAEPPVFDDL